MREMKKTEILVTDLWFDENVPMVSQYVYQPYPSSTL